MMEQTFCHVQGVGEKTEEKIWASGIDSWAAFAGAPKWPVNGAKGGAIMAELTASQTAFADGNPRYFYDRLKSTHHWRLFSDFKHKAAYIDIETTGLSGFGDIITTIALYDGRHIKSYVYGRDLDQFVADLFAYDLIVTYNGKTFDVPFIESFFGVGLPHAHIDLRYVLNALGYRGGLKGCEKQFGLSRNELDGVDGYFAVLLWHEFTKTGNSAALDTLLAYNIEDVVNLEYLMYKAYNLNLLYQTPFENDLEIAVPPRPTVPYVPDTLVVEKIKRKYGWLIRQ